MTFIPCLIPSTMTLAQSWGDLNLDTPFGTGGIAMRAFDFGQDDRDVGNAVVRVPGSGPIFNVGAADGVNAGDVGIAISGLRVDGVNDPSFGQAGRVFLDVEVVTDGVDIGRDIAVIPWPADSSWRLVVVGDVERINAGDRDFVVALVRPDESCNGRLLPVPEPLGTVSYTFLSRTLKKLAPGEFPCNNEKANKRCAPQTDETRRRPAVPGSSRAWIRRHVAPKWCPL